MATVSIVIPAYNASATLPHCLEACLAQTMPPHEIIVVDDESHDDTIDIADRYGVRVVKAQHAGPAAARNAGARAATGEIIAFTDADCVPERQWVAKLAEAFTGNVTGVGGSYACANAQHLLARVIHEEIVERHRRMPEEADFLGSFNAAYLRDAFWDAGGFDESFTQASGEDNDLAYRLHDAGGHFRFRADARVAHYHPHRLLPYLRTQARHGYWRMKLYRKHPRRKSGDTYAGIFDLWAPPMAVLVAVFGIILLILGLAEIVVPGLIAAFAALNAIYLLMHVPMTVRIVSASGKAEMLCYFLLSILRDYARAAGLITGVLWFYMLRRSTA